MANDITKLSDDQLENVAGGTLTRDEALAAAFEHAQLKADQVQFIKKVHLDFEHGRKVYEVEFYHEGFQYEYDIDAETGKILKFEKEWD